jgi:hypothetical protein
VQGALGVVLADQLVEQRVQGMGVPLTGQLRDHVALGVDHDERRPRLHGVLLPGREVRVVEHRVVHLVALHGRGHGGRVGLVLELGRVDAHGHQDVGELLLERAQLGQDVQAVHAAEGPEVEQDHLAAQVGQRELPAAGVEPAAAAQLGGTHPGPAGGVGAGHAVIQPCRPGRRSRGSGKSQKLVLDRYRHERYCSGTETSHILKDPS